MRQNIIVLDFGGQYNQLIARRVRECNVYCEVHPYTMPIEQIKQMAPSGIILTGGPNSVYGEDSPQCDPQIFKLGIPILGMGGIVTWRDAVEYMLAGAQMVAVGAANFRDPMAPMKVLEGIEAYCEARGITDVNELIGKAWK